MKRIPVILDTDIGGDIDDTWALAMANAAKAIDCAMAWRDKAAFEGLLVERLTRE